MKDEYISKDLLDLTTEFFNGDETQAIIWLCSPASAFGGLTPKQMCDRGEESEVEDLIHRLAHGIFI